jgi:hypothetical protein
LAFFALSMESITFLRALFGHALQTEQLLFGDARTSQATSRTMPGSDQLLDKLSHQRGRCHRAARHKCSSKRSSCAGHSALTQRATVRLRVLQLRLFSRDSAVGNSTRVGSGALFDSTFTTSV